MESVTLEPRPKNYLTTTQTGKRLGMTPRNVRYLITSGELDGQYVLTERGPIWRVTKRSIIAYEKKKADQQEH